MMQRRNLSIRKATQQWSGFSGTYGQSVSADVRDRKSLSTVIYRELVDERYCSKSRRRGTSIVRAPYRSLLDPFFSSGYPLNCIGTYARLLPDYLESFVNVGQVAQAVLRHSKSDFLCATLGESQADDHLYHKVRMATRDAIHLLGSDSYVYEWQDVCTHKGIDALLEGLAAYRVHNEVVARQTTKYALSRYAQSEPLWILDLGPGVGGTSIAMLMHLDQLATDGSIPKNWRDRTHLLLYDVSKEQLVVAQCNLRKTCNFINVTNVVGSFRDITQALNPYEGKIDIIISGAALCHAIEKDQFFAYLRKLLRDRGVLSFWDPVISQYQAHYLRLATNSNISLRYQADDGRSFELSKGEMLPSHMVKELGNATYTSIAEVPYEELAIFAIGMAHMYFGQMGYTATTVGENTIEQLMQHLKKSVIDEAHHEPGFNLLTWYHQNLLPLGSRVPRELWTPYDLIEAVSDAAEYRRIMEMAGFRDVLFRRAASPDLNDNSQCAVACLIGYFYGEAHS